MLRSRDKLGKLIHCPLSELPLILQLLDISAIGRVDDDRLILDCEIKGTVCPPRFIGNRPKNEGVEVPGEFLDDPPDLRFESDRLFLPSEIEFEGDQTVYSLLRGTRKTACGYGVVG